MKKSILTAGCFLIGIIALAQSTDIEKVKATVDKQDIKNHIYYLASDELKGRETGTPGIEKAADYIADKFKAYGVQPVKGAEEGYFQHVKLKNVTVPTSIKASIGSTDFAKENLALLKGDNIVTAGQAVFLNYGTAEDFEGKHVEGKVVVTYAGGPDQTDPGSLFKLALQKRGLAQKAGALALLEIHEFNPQYWSSVSGYLNHEKMTIFNGSEEEDGLAHLWVNDTSKMLTTLKVGENLKVKLTVNGIDNKTLTSRNVVGMVEGTDPKLKKEFIIYSAHYDHVGVGAPNAEGDSIFNGARDNAVGTVTVLSAAENIARYPTKRSALFILFTAEEKGLLGSKWYVEHPLIPLEQSVYCFNSDNASYNDTTKATIVGLERTTASQHIKDACAAFGLTAIDDPAPEQNLFDRSDNVHFAAKGIPAPTFSLGFTAFDAEVFKYYHQVTDNPETLDYDYLEKFFRSYVLSCRNIANADATPVWVEGDKYYEAGQKLYGTDR
ncbi:hypothetical protein C900_03553 [Fulvivirga imtechensis AK7]|uniref:Peptidase M28 domain-containing protein n=1 Tax=Fulvivirga imtechensis AK7 TaxID=1237149 RepID=L8JTA1_9BACT|nr:M28 family peptidase [Fulvivirga imtechensis]ELR70572.1 hypothetical protein C900_03553 [Fulvivirga imtechensis AK7]